MRLEATVWRALEILDSRVLGRVALALLFLQVVTIAIWLVWREPWPVVIPEPSAAREPIYQPVSLEDIASVRSDLRNEIVVAAPTSVDTHPCIRSGLGWSGFEVKYIVKESLRGPRIPGTTISVQHECRGALSSGREYLFWGESLFKPSPRYFERGKNFLLVVSENSFGNYSVLEGLVEGTETEIERWRQALGREP